MDGGSSGKLFGNVISALNMPPYTWVVRIVVSCAYVEDGAFWSIEDDVPLEHVVIILEAD